jgi:5-carboxymethyl-2-hydroxymuconate isomerase
MPHLTILYTPDLESLSDISDLCRKLADTMLAQRDEAGAAVFPPGGVRVLAYPAAHSAVADGRRDYSFAYLNLRMGRGRSELVRKQAGDALAATARSHFGELFEQRPLGVTIQIDEGAEVYDAKHSTIHPLFAKR